MTLAAQELILSKIKIIDLSHKHGYKSPEAFTRSFKLFHGISPTVARMYGKHVDYPRISFQLTITGGHFANEAKFEVYKGLLVKMETIQLSESLKIAGVTGEGMPCFQNIDLYHEKYSHLVAASANVGLSSDIDCNSWYTFGGMVDSIDDLPKDLVGIDTGLANFACLTFRMQPGSSSHDLVGGHDGKGTGMQLAGEYLAKEWIPKNVSRLNGYFANGNGYGFHIKSHDFRVTNLLSTKAENSYNIYGAIEIYKSNIEKVPEMCFYLPIK